MIESKVRAGQVVIWRFIVSRSMIQSRTRDHADGVHLDTWLHQAHSTLCSPVTPHAGETTMPKRKRASGVGTYTDQETGEVITVQTTKAARTAYKKSGAKWYKEPTEAELRMWERDDKRRAFVEEQERRAELKWKNAEKRRQREERDQSIQQDLYEQGKITYTQTLARKDEDQRNLHKWLGGRPRSPCAKNENGREGEQDINRIVFREQEPSPSEQSVESDSHKRHASDTEITASQYQAFLQDDLNHPNPTVAFMPPSVSTPVTRTTQHSQRLASLTQVERNIRSVVTDRAQSASRHHRRSMASHDGFNIAVDDDVLPDQQPDLFSTKPDQADEMFKVPALPSKTQPARQALSPLSRSDLNKRGVPHGKPYSFRNKLGEKLATFAELPVPTHNTPSTFMLTQGSVQSLLAGICTQDLSIDDEDLSEKENACPTASPRGSSQQERQQTPNSLSQKRPAEMMATVSEDANDSFTSANYDEIFADIDPDLMVGIQHHTPVASTIERDEDTEGLEDDFNFGDDELDDDTLLSLPATQMVRSSTRHSSIDRRIRTTSPAVLQYPSLTQFLTADLPSSRSPSPLLSRPAGTRMSLSKGDSFAMPGLSDDDLLEGLQEFEEKIASQQKSCDRAGQYSATAGDRPRSAPSFATGVATSEMTSNGSVLRHSSSLDGRKRRRLPWQQTNGTQGRYATSTLRTGDETGMNNPSVDVGPAQPATSQVGPVA